MGNLEKVRVGLVRGKVNVEDKGAVRTDLLLRRGHFEWILH